MKTKFSLTNLSSNLRLILIFIAILSAAIFDGVKAESQSSFLASGEIPDTITIGIRTPAKSVGHQRESGSWSGFCYFFGRELESEFKREGFNNVKTSFYPKPILNSYKGAESPRYDGLKKRLVDIECGPNTIINSKELFQKGWEHISFSQPFHTTGVKLLLKKGTFDFINIDSTDELIKQLKEKKIGVVRETTTYDSLVEAGYRPIDFGTRIELLKELENNNIEAYASDALVLKSLLEQDYRNINSQEEYTLFPPQPDKYLPDVSQEDYGVAVLKGTTHEDILIRKINDTISLKSLESYRRNLEREESAQSIDNIKSKLNQSLARSEIENFELREKLKGRVSRWWLLIISVAAIMLTLILQHILKLIK